MVFVISFLATNSLGKHIEDADPIYGGGEIIVDRKVTSDERVNHAIFIFVVLIIPITAGICFGTIDKKI